MDKELEDKLAELEDAERRLESERAAIHKRIEEAHAKEGKNQDPQTIGHDASPTREGRILHGFDQFSVRKTADDSASSLHIERITLQLNDMGVPTLSRNLSDPGSRTQFTDAECLAYLRKVTSGSITERTTEMDRQHANEMLTKLESERAALRKRFADYVEVPEHAVVGNSCDDLERKLFARHFRNKEAQHRVFMIGFSVALFAVIGAILLDITHESNTTLIAIASIVGGATTAVGIVGNLMMRIGDATNERKAVLTIQKLSLLDGVIDKIRIALR